MVLDQSIAKSRKDTKDPAIMADASAIGATLIYPRRNRLALFDGRLLHGVCVCARVCACVCVRVDLAYCARREARVHVCVCVCVQGWCKVEGPPPPR